MADAKPLNLSAALGQLKPKDKTPQSANVLNTWIAQAENSLKSDGGRLSWLVATTDPHDPPDYINDRARYVVDLVLIRALTKKTGEPTLLSIQEAVLDIVNVRAAEAIILGRKPRYWPTHLVAYRHWRESFNKAAVLTGLALTLEEAVVLVNFWLDEINTAAAGIS
jgi:hypothetical protein